ncbi:MAG: hypothetical protein Kow0090_09460 [Myxococcota bacterium]
MNNLKIEEPKKASVDIIDFSWSFFISLKLTVFTLIALALLSIIGTFLLQDKSIDELLKIYPEWLVSGFSLLGFFDMYRSAIFIFLELMLSLNVIACSINRFPASWRRARAGKRFNWQPMGVYFVHGSLLVIFVGALIGQFFGFRGFATIPEGEGMNYYLTSVGGGVYDKKPLPFTIKLEEFQFEQFESGAPKDYRSSLAILENGEVTTRKTIEVNDPLEYKGIMFYQSSYSELAPKVEVTLEFRNKESGELIASSKAKPGDSINPTGVGGYFVVGDFEEDKMGMGAALEMTFHKSGERAQNFVVFHRFPKFDEKNRESDVVVVLKEFKKKRRFQSGIEVVKDPGAATVFTGAFLMMLGLFMALYLKREKKDTSEPAPKTN